MYQVVQDINSGTTEIIEIPKPINKSHHCLIKTNLTLISSGTEKMLVDFGKSGLIGKALGQPEKVKMVLEKVKTDGLAATYSAVKTKLDEPMQLGYCNVGTILETSNDNLPIGTRVISNGKHASVVRVPNNLIAKIPDNVSDEEAVFTVLGSIAMQGIRLVNPTIGETVVVTGLGLIGLIAVQILKANGCKVIGIDFDSSKCELAKSFGAEVVNLSKGDDPIAVANEISRGRGVDAVLITASSKSHDIVHQAATMCRKRGRIVLVGVVGLELNRNDFYEKELTFQVSCSYGPGRYDPEYEDKGKDYPFAFVRWTQQRNFEAILDLISEGKLNLRPLISYQFEVEKAAEAYAKLDERDSLGIIINYEKALANDPLLSSVNLIKSDVGGELKASSGRISFIGGGNYASRVLIPAFKNAGAELATIVTSTGISAVHNGKKAGFSKAATDIGEALGDSTDAVVIATQHNLHASQAISALEKGKHVFVEKPLALTHEEINEIEDAQRTSNAMVMVGYNRRFAPQVQKIKALLAPKKVPKTFIMTMNAGAIPADHWTQDPAIGGGRIIGEACHYIDLMRFLAGAKITSFNAVKMGDVDGVEITEDKAIITLTFEDGSVGSIHYFANGGKAFPKERVEVFCDDAVLQLDNFRKLTGFGWKGFSKMNLWSQDKGQANCTKAFVDAIQNGNPCPIPADEIFEVARISVDIAQQLRK
ncbi:bi-domain-containing oxidoreductase [Bowmanella sp. JS7-9]|uniref:Bi-domain-containing oxidoreductase n=2 Tax=Pseudobowmanella zhangzhouensis TaxID=1537679 RepID=A0ABW1XIG7_9ALTE|nr:bi-domain-containing oxidoreductase [Bowmanella sp. JS7-9]TBX25662.1 dehydrogenase [Bowmanella sp. JS7-9]